MNFSLKQEEMKIFVEQHEYLKQFIKEARELLKYEQYDTIWIRNTYVTRDNYLCVNYGVVALLEKDEDDTEEIMYNYSIDIPFKDGVLATVHEYLESENLYAYKEGLNEKINATLEIIESVMREIEMSQIRVVRNNEKLEELKKQYLDLKEKRDNLPK